MKKKKVQEVRNEVDNESMELNIEELTEVQGGIESNDKEVPAESCGLGCYLGAGSTNEPTELKKL
jgi:hypothetical protein